MIGAKEGCSMPDFESLIKFGERRIKQADTGERPFLQGERQFYRQAIAAMRAKQCLDYLVKEAHHETLL